VGFYKDINRLKPVLAIRKEGAKVMPANFVLHFLDSGQRFPGQEEIVGGKSKDCDLNLSDYFRGSVKTISRQHFKISSTTHGLVIIDLNSTNGTQVNKERLAPKARRVLRHGDTIQLAKNNHFIFKVLIEEDDHRTELVEDTERLVDTEEVAIGLSFDELNSLFYVDGKVIPPTHLTEFEFNLLKYLYDHTGYVCEYSDIAKHVWGGWVGKNPINKMISKLRYKLNKISHNSGKEYLRTIRGYNQGYMLIEK